MAWNWSPNWNSGPNVSWNKMQRYYPGDAYVDWLSWDPYNFAGCMSGKFKRDEWKSFTEIVRPFYDWLDAQPLDINSVQVVHHATTCLADSRFSTRPITRCHITAPRGSR